MKIQLLDHETRIYIGSQFEVNYRLNAGDEVYYEGKDGDEHEDTVWSVVFCRTDSYMPDRQLVFVTKKDLKRFKLLGNSL